MPNRVYIANESGRRAGTDLFDEYQPPFDLEADILFVFSAARTDGLAEHFPGTRFLRLGGATPLMLWFSRVRSLTFGEEGGRRRLDEANGFGYNELTVVAALRGRRFFVPVIHADGDLTQSIGRRYGMPKRKSPIEFVAREERIESRMQLSGGVSTLTARLLASGRIFGKVLELPAPWWSWPAHFPDGSFIRALVRSVPRAQLASVSGSVALDEPWLREPARLWPLGLYVPGFAMRLPEPGD